MSRAGLSALLDDFATGARTPSEVAERALERVEALPPEANVLQCCDPGRLRAGAAAATERWAAGRARPLEGVPLVVKDNIVVDGFPTTAGGRAGVGIPPRQAGAVDRLAEAGAIPYAKATMTEYALRAHGRNAHFGDVPAPGAPGYLAGGSSAGSAVAVRLGLAPAALGTDTAGSVRVPAACCGVVGYKPAHGALPLDGVVPVSPTCDHLGILAARVADLETLLPLLGAARPAGGRLPVVALPDERLGPLDAGLRAAYHRAIALLEAEVETPRFVAEDGFARAAEAYEAIRGREVHAAYGAEVAARPEAFGEETVRIVRAFARFTDADHRAGLDERGRLDELLRSDLEGRAVLLLPALRAPAPPVRGEEIEVEGVRLPLHAAFIAFMLAFSLVGVPAVVVPAGRLPGGLVASVQLVAARGDEGALLSAARRLEAGFGTVARPL